MQTKTSVARLALAAALSLTLAIPASAGAKPRGKISYISSRAIRVMNDDGSGKRLLTRSPLVPEASAWSPDGRQLIFTISGWGLRLVTPPRLSWKILWGGDSSPMAIDWSPDGTMIAFVHSVDVDPPGPNGERRRDALFVMNADGTGERELPTAGQSVESVTWSPDSRRVAYIDVDGRPLAKTPPAEAISSVRSVSVDGGPPVQMFYAGPSALGLTWSPDGKWLAFQSLGALHVARPDGSDEHQVGDLRYAGPPAWSPDSRWLAFSMSDVRQLTNIYKARLDGTGLRKLTSSQGADYPQWTKGRVAR